MLRKAVADDIGRDEAIMLVFRGIRSLVSDKEEQQLRYPQVESQSRPGDGGYDPAGIVRRASAAPDGKFTGAADVATGLD